MEDFVKAYMEVHAVNGTLVDLAKQLGITRAQVGQKHQYLLMKGVNLPKLVSGRKLIDVNKLNEIVDNA